MKMIRGSKISLRLSVLLPALAWTTGAGAYPVAGLEPSQRPAGAPSLTAAAPQPNAMHGVVQPVPESINRFMKDNGNWYSPFTRPGMPGPYDIRGWHSNPPSSGKR